MASVREWAVLRGYDYRFVGDEIFDRVPDWYLAKIGDRKPIATDFARLVLCEEALDQGYDQVVWLDADVLVFDDGLSLDVKGDCAFGQECWVQRGANGKWSVRHNLHNALSVFAAGGATLPFLRQTVSSIIQRADPQYIAPQMVGPKLLSALGSIAGFTGLPAVGALSPAVIDVLVGLEPEQALQRLKDAAKGRAYAMNLCSSLISEENANALIARRCELAELLNHSRLG